MQLAKFVVINVVGSIGTQATLGSMFVERLICIACRYKIKDKLLRTAVNARYNKTVWKLFFNNNILFSTFDFIVIC